MRCDKCQHWDDKPSYERVAGLSIRVCSKAVMFWDATDWDDECNRVLRPEYKGQKSFVQDGSDYRACLMTTGDFFCGHFEEKTAGTS